MISTRYAPAVIILLALSAVPTVIHSYMDSTAADGRSAREIPLRLGSDVGTATVRRADWGEHKLSATDWIERDYSGAPRVRLFVGRSYDPKKVYHHPELAVDYGQGYASSSIVALPGRPEVPVHMLRGGPSNPLRMALYVLEYDRTYVADPITFQLRTSFQLLFSGRRPMTLFYVSQDLAADDTPATSRAAAILLAAIDAFEAQARP